MPVVTLALLLTAIVGGAATGAVHSGREGRLDVKIPAVGAAIEVDGQLNEPVWQTAASLTDFSQYSPVDGRPAEQQTAVLACHNEHDDHNAHNEMEPAFVVAVVVSPGTHIIERGGLLLPYPDFLTQPMRDELTRLGFRELTTAADVDEVVGRSSGIVMVVVNSVCGCAAGRARPGIAEALTHSAKPDVLAAVFAGADLEATDRARQYFAGYPPSSPSVALLKDGKLLYMMERKNIEIRNADEIAAELRAAFDKYCSSAIGNRQSAIARSQIG